MNISGLKSLNVLSNNETASVSLPAKNSVVNFSILEKTGGNYKILINGKVFLAALPVNVKQGDSLLGIVLNNNPMVLNLVNILNLKSLNLQNLSMLLVKLGMKKTDNNAALLKAFIINKKPILKKQLDKLSEVVENLDFSFDENQLNYIVQLFANDDNYQQFDKQTAEYFRFPINEIIKEIFQRLQKGKLNGGKIEQINNLLTVNISGKEQGKELISELLNLDKLIISWVKENRQSPDKEINKLNALLSRYLIQKSFLQKGGIYHGFAIADKENEQDLVEYKFEKSQRDESGVHYIINIGMSSKEFGDILIDGLLTKTNLNLNFGMEESKKKYFEEEKESFKEEITKNLTLNTFVGFSGSEKGNRQLKKYPVNESINFKA